MKNTGKFAYWFSWPAIFIYAMFRKTARVIVMVDDEVLLVRSWLGNGTWSLPGGGKKFGELLEDAARRELSEELGLKLTNENLDYRGYYRSLENGITKKADVYRVVFSVKPVLKLSRELTGHSWQKIKLAQKQQDVSTSTREILNRAVIL